MNNAIPADLKQNLEDQMRKAGQPVLLSNYADVADMVAGLIMAVQNATRQANAVTHEMRSVRHDLAAVGRLQAFASAASDPDRYPADFFCQPPDGE